MQSIRKGRGVLLFGVLAGMALSVGSSAQSPPAENPYPAASHVPDSQPGWERFQTTADRDIPFDEAMGGVTARGTPITKRNKFCFPAENRNVFSEMDKVATATPGVFAPFAYGDDKGVTPEGRDAIRGQNTWVLWGEGNEAFWGWLQERGYGLIDFLVLLDSRKRSTRFHETGMLNQPGMKQNDTPNSLGLYFDRANGDEILLKSPANNSDRDAATGKNAERPTPPPNHPSKLFDVGDQAMYDKAVEELPKDGLDYTVYGYPSGVVGLRLFPNPDFFGKTSAAAAARARWQERVVNGNEGDYYSNYDIQADPSLVRPFRVSMSCGFCHVGPHPLNPPQNPEEPKWENMSSTIGNQYWTTPKIFANLLGIQREKNKDKQHPLEDSLLYQFLASEQPGTVDTSLISTDHINNANTITAVFDINERLARAELNPAEDQSPANLLAPVLKGGDAKVTPRRTPRVLLDGSDSIGAFGALSRVYLNIGTAPEQWARYHNPIIGFKPQRPFGMATLTEKSAYWQAGDAFRINYLASFFTHKSEKTGLSVVSPMKLASTVEGAALLAKPQQQQQATLGRKVFLDNCAICHSSKQPDSFTKPGSTPDEFRLEFSNDWATAPVPKESEPSHFVLPMHFEDWEAFRGSKMFAEYRRRIATDAGAPAAGRDEFLDNNYLSTDIRVPITLVGTNSGRAVATNAMRGQVWDNFSSEAYKNLKPVGRVRFFNPYSGAGRDDWGNNDQYYPPGNGPGYYRPASLISLWATSPYLHNNTLGLFNRDPSIAGRLEGFNDGIDKLLWKSKRHVDSHAALGDLRGVGGLAGSDPGFIYRVTEESWIAFQSTFVRQLVEGVLGPSGTAIVTVWLWVGLTAVWLALLIWGRARIAAFTLLLIAVASAALLVITRFDLVWAWLWAVPVLATAAAVLLWMKGEQRAVARAFFALVAILTVFLGFRVHAFVNGERGGIKLGPIPQGTPINLVMNINPEAPTFRLIQAVSGLTRGMLLSARVHDNPKEALRVFEKQAGTALLGASKCPDFVLDRGHWFAEGLTDEEKEQLKAFLLTL